MQIAKSFKEAEKKVKNPYRQDEKGKYVRGTGYEKPVTGSRTTHIYKEETWLEMKVNRE